MSLPLISCLCVSYQRPNYLINVIKNFLAQTYSNKELVIVSNQFDPRYHDIISGFQNKNIRYVFGDRHVGITLGDLRNMALDHCLGDYFCTWDDDDWNHNDRLSIQYETLEAAKKPACIGLYILIFDKLKKQLYVSFARPWEQTLMCSKKVLGQYGIRYPSLNRSEDSQFVTAILKENLAIPIVRPNPYIYVYHGKNTWNEEFFTSLFAKTQPMPSEISEKAFEIVNPTLSSYRF